MLPAYHRRLVVKKLLCVAAVLVAALPFAFSQGKLITVRALVPIDFAGTAHTENSDYDVSDDTDTKMGFGLGAEAMVGVWKELKVGGGVQYGFSRGLDVSGSSAEFSFIPVYGIVAYGFKLPMVNPYVIGRVGYNLFMGNDDFKNSADLKGGIYLTLGGGASFNIPGLPLKPFVELNYAIDNGQLDFGSGTTAYDVSYRRLQVAAGASFSL
jgi:hypothetical protein